jgi:hypothetical protein
MVVALIFDRIAARMPAKWSDGRPQGKTMKKKNSSRKLEKKRQELRKAGKPDQIGKPYDTSRELVEEGDRKRTGTNLDIDEERSEEQKREMRRRRRE